VAEFVKDDAEEQPHGGDGAEHPPVLPAVSAAVSRPASNGTAFSVSVHSSTWVPMR